MSMHWLNQHFNPLHFPFFSRGCGITSTRIQSRSVSTPMTQVPTLSPRLHIAGGITVPEDGFNCQPPGIVDQTNWTPPGRGDLRRQASYGFGHPLDSRGVARPQNFQSGSGFGVQSTIHPVSLVQ